MATTDPPEDVRTEAERFRIVRAGFESGDRIELTDDVWDEIDREAEDLALRGDLPNAHLYR